VGAIMAMAYDFSNFTADDLLEAELAEEERVARAQARADKSAGTLNAFKALMRQPQTARANVISSDFDAASLKAYSQGKDVENLQHIRKTMSSVIGTPALPLNDIAKFNEWYKTQKFPYRFEKDIRTAYNNMSGELEKQSQAEHAATITRPAAELTFKTAEGVRDYDLKRPNRQAILQEVIANYKAPRAGIPRISTVQAITLLQNRLVAEGTKQPDIDRAVDHLKEVIALQQAIEEGEINTTVGVISSQVFDELSSGVYGEDPVACTDALAKYDELISNYRGISEDQASKGRQKIDNLIAKMQAAITEERAVAAETQRVKVTRPKEALALRTAEAESRKLEGIDVRNLSQSKVGIVARYADSRNRDDWYLAREELQSIIDAQRTAGAVFTGSQIDQQFEELERSLAHLEPIVWTGDIKEVKQMTALADPTGKTKLQATIDRGMAVEAIKMGIRKDPILSQMEFFKNNINSYANGLVKALISNATGVYGSTIYYDPDADEILLIRDIPAHLGKTQETALIVNQPPSVDEEEALKAHGVLWISFAGTKGKL
jgi:hypothetical protein